ncbi:CIC11C00000001847 [Sungouiella intermedia]|uniref:CIC11C00000001847 n=1 Tax=Sungouiella intermedia TaxID=45354 RepID=A0A1L0B8P2_9ASCO|nr:CIC11C00000001847 [[Candida] intermedia]
MALFLSKSEDGIAQAWAMATLGSLLAHRRSLLKSVNSISIPETCQLIISSPTSTLPLRISSSLLYGMSLIYKQKVTCMFNDLLSVYTRISIPYAQPQLEEISPTSTLAAKKPSHRQYLSDDAKFNIAEDFVPDFELEPSVAMELALQIMKQDTLLNNIDPGNIPLAEEAEARDLLFERFMDKSYASIHMAPDEGYDVDFDFDQNGDIIVRNNTDKSDLEPGDVLTYADFDQDLHAIEAPTEELTKTHNSGSNDPHFSTTANLTAAADVPCQKGNKRKFRFVKDDQLYSLQGVKRSKSVKHQVSFPNLIELLSRTSPHFVNSCYKAVFGPVITSSIPRDRLPLAERHPRASQATLHRFFHDLVEIEEGRNIRAPNTSFDNLDIFLNQNDVPEDEQFFQDIDFDVILNLSLDTSLDELQHGNNEASPYAQMLSKFNSFVKTKLGQEEVDQISFEQLVPSKATISERSVTKRFAASAFASLLQLATLDQLRIESSDLAWSLKGSDIYLRMSHV